MLIKLKGNKFDAFYQLMQDSFPPDEYRPYHHQRALLDNPFYQIYMYEEHDELVAFFATWQSQEFIFLEHFAVQASFRNGGLGTKLLQAFLQQSKQSVIIEIEPPTNGDLEKRRAKFYERNGFSLSKWGYIQPALAKGYDPVPLVLMAYPQPLSFASYLEFKGWVFQHVYKNE
ncbi:GNAT family N-acetyltransferase [Alkalihalobacillus pseudalcaliphilus]|uniref:GNAT family N-acetyltransferase n=1 Tax=Alkalihalobacillus pseudalcaliphilus TaxID=79884 RepID=UPI00064DD068|nr:GNAT family N-acetyltransferase [Alkalihalobacillus pseudalcaliphilus]KMK77559.1 hypothetical protein AB990_03590 [Alkalihalobacillus pseudalcaliphilus]